MAFVATTRASSPPLPIVGRRSPGAGKGRCEPPLRSGPRSAFGRPLTAPDAAPPRREGRSTFLQSRPRHRAGPGRGPHHAPGHRRRRTDPRLSNAQPTGALSQGHLSANCRTAVETRAHQSGGQPTSPAPAHGRALTRSPPSVLGAKV